MATLALAAAGAALGGALLPAGISVLGTTIAGATIGSQLGALAGSVIDQALFASSGQSRAVQGPRLADLRVTASTEGAPMPRLYGRARLGGQIIWATDFDEEAVQGATGGGTKSGILGGASAAAPGSVSYRYVASFAVAVCEGEIAGIGRIWADGREIDLADITTRLHTGSETQAPDSLILAKQGSDAPAYRGVAYIVFERLPLAPFGNRLPQLSFEVHRTLDDLDRLIRGVVLIPGSGEFAYSPTPINRQVGLGHAESENAHTRLGGSDWDVAIDQLQASLPNARSVSLVVSWFGTDLRAGHCQLRPCVESADKVTSPLVWSVAGQSRSTAPLVSSIDGRPAYGGTPSDASVVAAIRDLKAKGFSVVLNPFVLMDVPALNVLPDPYTGALGQPAYPWRGRITCDPAPDQPSSPDKSVAASLQIAPFVGTAALADYSLSGDEVVYTGTDEWSFRRMILHYAWLAKAAGGVDAFLLGSELRGLTHIRSGTSTYPFVAALVILAAEIKSILGAATKVTYAADWSEFFGHQPTDGSGDVHFHLDALWSSPSIDAIGIDVYWPLADWRDGSAHLDHLAGTRSSYDLAYLKGNLFGGEGFEWYYASAAARSAQLRTPITDGAGKPWVFRYKDLRSWWQSAHHDRPGGIESAVPTAWQPQSKPFWLLEIGCPAVDKGANQPNLFIDPKSSESALPYFSHGTRDDLMQRRLLQAFHEAFDPGHAGYVSDANPASEVYSGRMLSLEHMHVYAWDARPYPAFPSDTETWSDGINWRLGHWLNGRIASVSLAAAVARLLDDAGFPHHDTSQLCGTVPGYVVDRIMSGREALQPLELAYFVDATESHGRIVFRHRGIESASIALTPPDLVETAADAPLSTLTRSQETELPLAAKLAYLDSNADYRQAVVEARRRLGASGRIAEARLAIVLQADQATQIAESWLHEAWFGRERCTFSLPPSRLAVEPGDTLTLSIDSADRLFRVTEVGEHGTRDIVALALDPQLYGTMAALPRPGRPAAPPTSGPPFAVFLDLPLLVGDEPPQSGYIAAIRKPWPGSVAVYRSPELSGFALKAMIPASATLGVTLDALPAGPEGRLDHASRLRVRIDSGTLVSVSELALLDGANSAAIQGTGGDWEVIQFRFATLVGPRTYELSSLLRGQAGTEQALAAPLPAAARFVLLDLAVTRVDMSDSEIGLPFNWRYGPASHDIGAAAFATTAHTFQGRGRKPLSPAHVRGTRAANDLTVNWVRRTRSGGDNWESVEVPLSEGTERYEIDILQGASVVRTLSSQAPSTVYTAAQQIADFGSVQGAISLRVYQLSATAGRGSPRHATV